MAGSAYVANPRIPAVGASAQAWMAILNSTNTSPISITTTTDGSTPSAHGLTSGDSVEVVGHGVNTNANGVWSIIVTSTSSFTLQGSVGNGVGARTGCVQTITVDPSFTLPNSGDKVSAASVGIVGQGSANVIPWLYERTGKYRLVDVYGADSSVSGVPWTNWGIGGGSWPSITNYNTPVELGNPDPAQLFVGYVNKPGFATGDYLLVELTTSFNVQTSGAYAPPTYALQATLAFETNGGSYSQRPESVVDIPIVTSGGVMYTGPVVLRAVIQAPPFSVSTSFGLAVYAALYNSSGGTGAVSDAITAAVSGIYYCSVQHYRQNNLPGVST